MHFGRKYIYEQLPASLQASALSDAVQTAFKAKEAVSDPPAALQVIQLSIPCCSVHASGMMGCRAAQMSVSFRHT